MLKKIIVFMLLLLSLFVSGYSADHYLTGCGNSVWVSGDTYYLNFTNPTITSGTTCFTGNPINVNIIQLNEIIYVDVPTYLYFFSGKVYNSNFTNLNIVYISESSTNRFFNNLNQEFSYNIITNSIIKNVGTFMLSTGTSAHHGYNEFYNTFISGETGFSTTSPYRFNNAIFSNSIFLFSTGIYGAVNYQIITFTNTTILSPAGLTCDSCSYVGGNLITTGLITRVDIDDNGVDDSNIKNKIYNEYTILGNKFLLFQDFNEGQGDGTYNFVLTSYQLEDTNIFYLNDETFDSFDIFTTTLSGTSSFLGDLSLGTPHNIVFTGNLDCSLVSDIKCILDDSAYVGTLVDDYRGLLIVSNDMLINNINFDKSQTNNAHMISNNEDNLRDNIEISNSIFTKSTGVLTGGEDSSNEMLKLYFNNANIHNNQFSVSGTNEVFELLSLKSTSYTTNKIYNNEFFNNVATPTGESVIFNSYCDALFYNNYIDSNIVLEDDGCNGFLDTNVYVGFEHTDNKIYYYDVGNYYVDYVACVDSDNDGFCDDDYDDGTGWGNKSALSSYPFDYTAHLLTALDVVDNLAFDITLENIVNNETIELIDGSEELLFEFSHNSDFNDLICSVIIDGINDGDVQAYLSTTIYNISKTGGWTEKSYTYRVECYNDYQYIISDEFLFNIVFETIILGCTDSGANNYNPLATSDDGSCTYDGEDEPTENGVTEVSFGDGGSFTNLFSDNPEEVGSNLTNLFGIMSVPYSQLLIIGMVIFGIAILILVISIPIGLIVSGGKK